MSNIIAQIEAEQMTNELPAFSSGDTVVVKVKVKEGTTERIQAFEGIVIAKRNRGVNSAFTVRVFQTYSKLIAGVEVKRRGSVRRAKLYYLRELRGKAARIKEKL